MLDNATSSYKMIQGFLQPNESKTYTLNDTVQFWDIYDSPNKTSWNTHHYMYFNVDGNICTEMYYIYYLSGTTPFDIKLSGNETKALL